MKKLAVVAIAAGLGFAYFYLCYAQGIRDKKLAFSSPALQESVVLSRTDAEYRFPVRIRYPHIRTLLRIGVPAELIAEDSFTLQVAWKHGGSTLFEETWMASAQKPWFIREAPVHRNAPVDAAYELILKVVQPSRTSSLAATVEIGPGGPSKGSDIALAIGRLGMQVTGVVLAITLLRLVAKSCRKEE